MGNHIGRGTWEPWFAMASRGFCWEATARNSHFWVKMGLFLVRNSHFADFSQEGEATVFGKNPHFGLFEAFRMGGLYAVAPGDTIYMQRECCKPQEEREMLTNELKKGDMVTLRNGWKAKIEDNKKGNTRMATVYGHLTEMGSVYAHDIVCLNKEDGTTVAIELTDAQKKLRKTGF